MARKPILLASAEIVTVRVLPKGDGKVCTGAVDAVFDDETQVWAAPTYARGDTFEVGRDIATELEDRGFVEIQP